MKGLTIRNTHVKYESPSTYQSKVMTEVKVLLTDRQTDRQSDYYRAPAICGALKSLQTDRQTDRRTPDNGRSEKLT